MALAIGGSSVGFLYWNWPSAKIFMRDVGSGAIGLLGVVVALFTLRQDRSLPIHVVLLPLLPLLLEASVTLVAAFDAVSN